MLTPESKAQPAEPVAARSGPLPESFLSYRRFRYLKLTLVGLVVAIAVYILHDPIGPRNGGTVVGYALGAVSAALVLWLMWFGVRKRSFAARGSTVKGWLSAHVYLGTALVLLVPLHSGFQLDWNVHTLAYALVCLSVASGLLGARLYVAVPERTTRNRAGLQIDTLLEQIRDIDTEAARVARQLPNEYAQAVGSAIQDTEIGGSLLEQLSGRDPACATARAQAAIHARDDDLSSQSREDVTRLIELLSRKSMLLERLRRDVRYQAMMKAWLILHLPFSVATLVAVILHVVLVFYYR